MAILDKKKSKVSDEVPSASMADIAFLLLIFFLVTTTFPKDKGLAIVLPEQGEDVQVSQRNILHMIIMPNGIVEIKRGESSQVQQVSPSAIEGLWRQEVAENENRSLRKGPVGFGGEHLTLQDDGSAATSTFAHASCSSVQRLLAG